MKAGKSVNSAETDAPEGGKGMGIVSVCLLVTRATSDVRNVANKKALISHHAIIVTHQVYKLFL